MKTSLAIMSFTAIAIILSSCSNDEKVMDNWNGEILLNSGVVVQTRAQTLDTQIKEGEDVYVWLDTIGTSTVEYIKAWKLAAATNSGFTGNSQYYPTTGKNLDIYALHGNFAGTPPFTENSTTFPTAAIIHTVESDQSNADKNNYAKSDLLYAIKKNVARSSNAVSLNFYHLLSKVEVALKSGTGSPDLKDAVITIENTKLKTDFTPSKAADINNSTPSTSQAARAALVPLTSDNNEAAPITIGNAVTTNENWNNSSFTYNEAIIIPQQLTKDAVFIKVTLSGTTFSYKLPEITTFASGKKYQYQITVNQTGLSVDSSITDWDSTAAVTGGAEMD